MNLISFFRVKAKSSFLKSVSTLTGGSILAQVTGVLLSPVLSRLYTPHDFGVIGSLLAFTGIVSLLGSMKYDMALVIENDDEESRKLLDLNIVINVLMTIVATLILLLAPYCMSYFDNKDELVSLLPYGIPIILFSNLYNTYYARFNREKEYKKMAVYQIIRRSTTVLSQVALGFLISSAIGLAIGGMLGVIVPVLLLVFIKSEDKLFNYTNIDELKRIAAKYIKFPKFTAPQSFINLLSAQLPVFVLGYYFQLEVVGAYFFTLKLVQVPANFFGLSIRQVFFREAAQIKENLTDLKRLFIKLTFSLFLLGVLPISFFFYYSEDLFVHVFGIQWKLAGVFASWMFLWYGSTIISGPARSLFLVFEKQKDVFVIDLILFVIRFGGIVFLAMNFSSIVVIKWFSLLSVISNLFVICWWFFFFKKH